MVQQPTHPTPHALSAFTLGQLPEDEAASVEGHVSECPTCCETLLNLQTADTFVDLLQVAKPVRSEDTIGLQPADGIRSPSVNIPAQLAGHARYEVLGLIGKGGMGDVFKARHRLMDRTVALKVISSVLMEKPEAVDRFQREVKTAASLAHPNIVTAHDADHVGDVHFLVMEFVDGVNLDEVVRKRGRLSVTDACDYIRQAAAGLQHAHERGMVHRDIKPHNLMLATSGEVKILDFGLANFASEFAADPAPAQPEEATPASVERHQLTLAGTMMGTPDYMSPEQADDAHAADIRADIYSLGCTFYTLLTGRAPFGERTVLDTIKAHREQTAQPLSAFRDDVPAEVESVLLRMLDKDPARRFQTPAEVAHALAVGAPNHTPTLVDPAEKRTRIRPRWLIATACAFLAAIAATAVFYIQTDHGVVRVELGDESLQATINGQTITVQDGDKPLTIQAGEPKLVVRRGDFEFETESFQLRRGAKIALKVEVIGSELIVKKDGQRFATKTLPEPIPDKLAFVRKLEGHAGAVKSVAYSPDGTLIASASGFPHSDGTIRIWNVKQSKEIRQLKDHKGQIQSLCFSHDGQQLLAGGSDKLLRLWDVASGELLKTLAGHEGTIETVGLSANGRIAVSGSVATSGSTDHTARSWDLTTGKEMARFTGHKLHVQGVAVIDETRAISVDRMGVAYIWRLDNGQQLKRLVVSSTASNSAYSLAVSPDRKQAIIGYQDHSVRVWDVNSGELSHTLSSKNSPVMSVCMSADQRFVLAGGGAIGDAAVAIEVFELATGRLVAATEPMNGTTWSIALSPDGRNVLSAGGAKWSAEDGFLPNGDYALYVWRLPESAWAKAAERIVVELKADGQFIIEGRSLSSLELLNRLQWILKEQPNREVYVLPAKKFSGEPFRQLVSLVRSAGGKHVTWPTWVDEKLLEEITGPELDPAIADAADELVRLFEKHLNHVKANKAVVGEFPGNLPARIGQPLRADIIERLREHGFEVVDKPQSPRNLSELSGVSYDVTLYKGLPKLDIRWQIRGNKTGGHQGSSGAMTTYGRKAPSAPETPERE